MLFLTEARLLDKVVLIQDSTASRDYVAKKTGQNAQFPALELPDRIIMYPDMDGMVDYLAKYHKVDISSLYLYNDYVTGVYVRYGKLMGYCIKNVGGWPQVFPTLGFKNLLIIGATGVIGSCIVKEAASRGHKVFRACRKFPQKLEPFSDIILDANDAESIVKVLDGKDVVICALGPSRKDSTAPPLAETWKAIMNACNEKKKRAIFVGGAGSLLVDGKRIVDGDNFPESIKNEANQHCDALEYLRTLSTWGNNNWTVLTPPKMIQPGEKSGKFVLGQDTLVGDSISTEDFAVALMDEVQNENYKNARFTVASP